MNRAMLHILMFSVNFAFAPEDGYKGTYCGLSISIVESILGKELIT